MKKGNRVENLKDICSSFLHISKGCNIGVVDKVRDDGTVDVYYDDQDADPVTINSIPVEDLKVIPVINGKYYR